MYIKKETFSSLYLPEYCTQKNWNELLCVEVWQHPLGWFHVVVHWIFCGGRGNGAGFSFHIKLGCRYCNKCEIALICVSLCFFPGRGRLSKYEWAQLSKIFLFCSFAIFGKFFKNTHPKACLTTSVVKTIRSICYAIRTLFFSSSSSCVFLEIFFIFFCIKLRMYVCFWRVYCVAILTQSW